eukprot:TRINITY_DN33237_c2_g1_i1.p2 TRINITY_DN33237_c2_g1~~TRINITY_DN33237_c2_g1_i1.p2  ORF type:complete len:157 (-),score=2.09 TRINITY_DN33237_c2_g1_i1:58-528(-)
MPNKTCMFPLLTNTCNACTAQLLFGYSTIFRCHNKNIIFTQSAPSIQRTTKKNGNFEATNSIQYFKTTISYKTCFNIMKILWIQFNEHQIFFGKTVRQMEGVFCILQYIKNVLCDNNWEYVQYANVERIFQKCIFRPTLISSEQIDILNAKFLSSN